MYAYKIDIVKWWTLSVLAVVIGPEVAEVKTQSLSSLRLQSSAAPPFHSTSHRENGNIFMLSGS